MRFAASPQMRAFMQDGGMDVNMLADIGIRGRSNNKMSAMKAEADVAGAGLESMAAIRQAKAEAEAMKAQGQAEGQMAMAEGIGSLASGIGGGLLKLPRGGGFDPSPVGSQGNPNPLFAPAGGGRLPLNAN